jgi:hypothetical protein
MRTADATVLECRPDKVRIVVAPSECDTKTSCKGCTSCAEKPGARKMWLPIRCGESLSPGIRVRFTRYVVNEALAALLLFGLPILTAASTLIVWSIVAPERAESPVAVGSAVLAFAAGFGFSWGLEKLFLRIHPPRLDPMVSNPESEASQQFTQNAVS